MVIVDNTGGPSFISLSTTSSLSEANVFTTDSSQNYHLDSITVQLAVPADHSSPLVVQLWTDSSSAPGSLLATLSGATPTAGGNFTYSASGEVDMSANSRYWVVLSTTGSASYGWAAANFPVNLFNTGVGTVGGFSQNAGSGWSAESSSDHFVFKVVATPAPEPSTFAMTGGIALVAFGLWRRSQS